MTKNNNSRRKTSKSKGDDEMLVTSKSSNRAFVVQPEKSKEFSNLLDSQKQKNKDFDDKCKAIFNKLKK